MTTGKSGAQGSLTDHALALVDSMERELGRVRSALKGSIVGLSEDAMIGRSLGGDGVEVAFASSAKHARALRAIDALIMNADKVAARTPMDEREMREALADIELIVKASRYVCDE
jgi:hypothetical protein